MSEVTELKREIHKELESWHGVEGGIDEDGINKIMSLIDQLDKPETLSQAWIDENKVCMMKYNIGYYIPVGNLQNLLVPTLSETETVEITEEQVMEWLDNNDFYCHATAETVLANAVDKGE